MMADRLRGAAARVSVRRVFAARDRTGRAPSVVVAEESAEEGAEGGAQRGNAHYGLLQRVAALHAGEAALDELRDAAS